MRPTTRITEPDPDCAGSLPAAYTDFTYDSLGNLKQSSDALGNTTSYQHDAWWRVIEMIDAKGKSTTRDYDAFGNLRQVVDPLGNTTEYAYNRLDRLVSENKLDASSTDSLRSYSYDGVGNLRSFTDRNGRTTEWSYDSLYRPAQESWKSGTATVRTLDTSYDAVGRLTGVDDSDSLATDFEFQYDSIGQLQLERQLTGLVGTSVVFDRDYDQVGKRTRLEANLGGSLLSGAISGGLLDFATTFD